MTPRVQRTLVSAAQEAQSRGHDYVGTEHLLIALAQDHDGIAGQVLATTGVDIVETVRSIMSTTGYSTPGEWPEADTESGGT